MTLRWKGDQVSRHVKAAATGAVDETVREAARQAASEWPVDTGLSASSIDVIKEAEAHGPRVVARWGGRILPSSGDYSASSRFRVLFEEIGVMGRPGLGILRRSADSANRHLAGRIRSRLR